MKRNAIRALIIGTAVVSTITFASNSNFAMATEKTEGEISITKEDYAGFSTEDMSGGDAALGLDKGEVPATYNVRNSAPVINGIQVSKQLININYTKGETITPKYIVIHDTDNRRVGATAQANRDYFANHDNANASAHYIIDQGNIIQALEDTWKGWHVGDGGMSAAINNSNTIGIELAVNAGNDFKRTYEHGIALTRYLMNKYNIPAENVVMHKHASGKTCSRMMIEDEPELWTIFKEGVAKGMPGEDKIIDGKGPISIGSVVNLTGNYLNIRQSPSTTSTVLSKLHKNAKVKIYGEEGGFYKISYMETKKGYGYVSKDYIKVNSVEVTPEPELPEVKPEEPTESKKGQVINVTSTLNVRSGAGTTYGVLGSLKANEIVKVTGETGDWYKIDFNGKVGYVSKGYIKLITDNVESTPTPEAPKPEVKPETPPAVETKTGQVTGITTVLNVRSGAGTNYSVIGSLKPSQTVKVTGESGSWYKIDFSGKVGYVSKSYMKIVVNNTPSTPTPEVKPEAPTPEAPSTDKKGKVIGITTSLNVRSGAGTNYSIIAALKPNETVTITGESGSWYKISISGKTGYISKQYITVTSTGTGSTVVPPTTAPQTSIGTVFDITTKLNIRTAESTTSSIIGYLYNGNKVTITGESTNWYKINFNGKVGYVSKAYIKK